MHSILVCKRLEVESYKLAKPKEPVYQKRGAPTPCLAIE